ncbi:glycosyltransferase family 2 protein [Mangrovibacterium lignilyticum]|uniref:glycosyltransferase family 2 protein n=1 Tax=Mangrovibacterium lignilyticum TaxID=2668052 RepID=UPI0013D05CC5|nr:glycosyltransferase family 2 protein [Mangrovibacterium lignilyticum]
MTQNYTSQSLSIIIPTYNRRDQLLNQLNSIISQDISAIQEILILDNNSNYDVYDLVTTLKCSKIRVIKNSLNIKAPINIANAFYHCKTQWFWLLSDDDESKPDSLTNIIDEISQCSEDVGMIKFAIDRPESKQKDTTVRTLQQYIDFYYDSSHLRRGDLVFISTNVYNVCRLKDYIPFAFEYSYTYIPHLIPIFKGLDEKKILVKFSSIPIVKYIPPRGDGYSFATVGKGLSTLSHIPLNLNKAYRKKFLDICMSITYTTLLKKYVRNDKIDDIDDIRIIYDNVYKYYLSFHSKIKITLFLTLMSSPFLNKITMYMIKNKVTKYIIKGILK